MKEFVTAVGEKEREGKFVFKHDGQKVTFYEPTSGQMSMMLTFRAHGDTPDQKTMRRFITMFFEMMDEETQDYFEDRLLSGSDPFELDGEGGVLDIFDYLTEEWSGKQQKKPSDYQRSSKSTSRSSTASTRAKGSTSSKSRSRAS